MRTKHNTTPMPEGWDELETHDANFVINDREDQVRTARYRHAEKEKLKAAQIERDILEARRKMAKEFQNGQSLLVKDSRPFTTFLDRRLATGQQNPVKKDIAKGMLQISKYSGVLGLFKCRNTQAVKELKEPREKAYFHSFKE